MRYLLSLLTLLTAIITNGLAQELPRRAFLGTRLERITDDVARVMNLPSRQGVLISEVLPRSTAQAAGFQKGDVLLSLNGKKTDSVHQTVSYLGGLKTGATLMYELLRARKRVSGKTSLKSFPQESYEDLTMEYDAVKSSTGTQRLIISKPIRKGKLPVVAFIGGIGCYSLEFPFDSSRSEVQLLNTLSRAGFLTARIEKPGMGDGRGFSKDCDKISFLEEADSYVQAIRKLKQRPDADSTQVFIFGHSMGGLMAPLIAQQTPVKGIIAYGTIGSSFIEYLLKTRRTIGLANGWSPAETDTFIKQTAECASYYFVEGMTAEEAEKKQAGCGERLSIFDLRSRAYNRELYSFGIPALWQAYDGNALLLWGESDFIASREDHQIIADAVNFSHPGNGQFISVPQTDHGMNSAANFQAATRQDGRYNPEVARIILRWLQKSAS